MILIIGYGNPIRGDDALGQIAADYLAERFEDESGVHARAVQQLTPDLAETLANYDTAVLIDARHRAPAGQVFLEALEMPSAPPARTFSHHVTPGELLLLADKLYGPAPRMYLTGITATSFEVGEPVSAPVRAALPALYARIEVLVREEMG